MENTTRRFFNGYYEKDVYGLLVNDILKSSCVHATISGISDIIFEETDNKHYYRLVKLVPDPRSNTNNIYPLSKYGDEKYIREYILEELNTI